MTGLICYVNNCRCTQWNFLIGRLTANVTQPVNMGTWYKLTGRIIKYHCTTTLFSTQPASTNSVYQV